MPLLQRTPRVFIDVETTGLEATDELIELAIIAEDGQVLFNSLVRPSGTHTSHAEHIHGITAEDLAAAPSFAQVEPAVSALLANTIHVAHNIDYDLELIMRAYALNALSAAPTPAGTECTMSMAMKSSGSSTRLRLHDALEHFGVEKPDKGSFHRAAYDAECARRLWLAIPPVGSTQN